MDYQFVFLVQLISGTGMLLVLAILNPAHAIVARDLVLTPRQGLQLNGKSLYYTEAGEHYAGLHKPNISSSKNYNSVSGNNANNNNNRPWERTLKHVTFITLFANADTGPMPGNLSQQKDYMDFLQSTYLSNGQKDVRFGDIVTLASGRLEAADNTTQPQQRFRFVEGVCEHNCVSANRIWALWQVQKIRHRDQRDTRKYHHEIRYSISPMRAGSSGAHKRRADIRDFGGRNAALQTYIQKEADYPQNFVPIVFKEEPRFAQRTQFDAFRPQVDNNAPAMPQSTFLHNFYQPHPGLVPPPPPAPSKAPTLQRLNIGEYGGAPQAQPQHTQPTSMPKFDIFPNILQFMSGGFGVSPTTYRPNYQYKLPKPNVYRPTEQQQQQQYQTPHPYANYETSPYQDAQKFQQNVPQDYLAQDKITTPVITHHFHHHFYTPTSSGEHNSVEDVHAASPHKPDTATPQYYKFVYEDGGPTTTARYPHPTATSAKYIFGADDIEAQRIVHVTPAPPLKKPTHTTYTARPILYYGHEEVEQRPVTFADNKTFIQSESLDGVDIRYSEPDPLYLTAHTELPSYDEAHDYGAQQQLESPQIEENASSPRHSIRKHAEDGEHKSDLEHKSSQKDEQITAEQQRETTTDGAEQESTIPSATTSTTTTATTTTTTTTSTTTAATTTTTTTETLELPTTTRNYRRQTPLPPAEHFHTKPTAPSTTTTKLSLVKSLTSGDFKHFVSTSTSEAPLKAVASRVRGSGTYARSTTTTTEQPVLKWKPRRKSSPKTAKQFVEAAEVDAADTDNDSKAKGSARYEEAVRLNATEELRAAPLWPEEDPRTSKEIYEVLTQKSVSKSVSIKVGADGEEIPIIIDDDTLGESTKAKHASSVKHQL